MPLPPGNPTKWKKGQPSPNPKGRPKKLFNCLEELKDQLTDVDPNDAAGRTRGQIMIAKLIEAATGQNSGAPSIRAINEINDRLLGKPPQAVAIADLRDRTAREQAIEGILESVKILRESAGSGEKPTIN